jgi:hypothetical protein
MGVDVWFVEFNRKLTQSVSLGYIPLIRLLIDVLTLSSQTSSYTSYSTNLLHVQLNIKASHIARPYASTRWQAYAVL